MLATLATPTIEVGFYLGIKNQKTHGYARIVFRVGMTIAVECNSQDISILKNHSERKHSKFSASGAERWFNCPGSVALSEGQPDKTSKWAEEGTTAHEVLENLLLEEINGPPNPHLSRPKNFTKEMYIYGRAAKNFILELYKNLPQSEIMVETKIYLSFIHKEMFGTFDGAVIDHFGTLHVFDYKYGAGHAVSPIENLQMIFYGIGLAAHYDWNFKKVALWIIQPRIKGYDGPLFWELGILELKAYVKQFKNAVDRVENNPDKYVEGSWCHWCKAKTICPLKTNKKLEQAKLVFTGL